MKNRNHTQTLFSLSIVLLIFLACSTSSGVSNSVTQTPAVAVKATLNEVQGQVSAKQPSEANFSPAQNGLLLQTNGEVQTGDDGRVRVDLSSGTFFRAGPSSHFTITANDTKDGNPFTQLQLEFGKIWVILTTGALEIKTPSGVATVRGSYLYVETLEDKSVKISCLEGDCSLMNDAGSAHLIAGQTATVTNTSTAPVTGKMSEDDFNEWLSVNPEAQVIIPAVTATQNALPSTATPTPQPITPPSSFGPDQFPAGYNPLSGEQVADPNLLQTPALLVSVSHFPATARPQAGLSFAPWVFEFYITEGATRFLAAFYGNFPKTETPIIGNCEVRREPFQQTSDMILGNQVWLDTNNNGRQESFEPGVGGVCVNLYDASGALVQSTTTDSNGYYGFNVSTGKYTVEFVLPNWLQFTSPNIGDENADSDADPASGKADADVQSTQLTLDAGLLAIKDLIPTPEESYQPPKAEIGPIRSGRLLYADIAGFFPSSCLIYAFASAEVLDKIPQCSFVAHEDAGGGSMMPIDRMEAVAQDNKNHTANDFNYSSNVFNESTPAGGVPANQIDVYVALLNQSGWTYDPAVGAWLRYVDDSTKENAGKLHPEVDRLTGRQLKFENFIIVYTDHDVISPTNLDIHLEQGDEGNAVLFRDGMKYDILWSNKAGDYEQQTGKRRPMQFLNPDGTPANLKPGSTWIFIATPYSVLSDEGAGLWKLRYYPPDGAK
ncbi:MAG: SdrD B-like domain-containing protein [Anaerolineales bacterium]